MVYLGFYFSAAFWATIFGLSLCLLSLIRSFHIRLIHYVCHTLIKSSTSKSKLLPNVSPTSIRWFIESNYNNPLADEKSAWKKNKTKSLILLLILFQSPSYTATLGLKRKVVPGSLIAQGSVTLNIKINPQSKTQINFLFLPYLKNQTKHNYC